jgi:ABC-type glutathione transport system ATPase component
LDGNEVKGKSEFMTPLGVVIVPVIKKPARRRSAIIHLPLSLMDPEIEVIKRFSELVRQGAKGSLKKRLQLVLPRLTDVEVITNADGIPFILATTNENDRLPLQALGGGMQRLFRLFVSFGQAQSGIILIDEIENGLYHRVLPELWRQLRIMVQEFDLQLFVTTHSHECLLAALDAFKDDPGEIAVHGLYRTPEDSSVHAVTYADETLQSARELDLELR